MRFNCPRRGETFRINTEPFAVDPDGHDEWRSGSSFVDGLASEHCPYCGSLSGDMFMAAIKNGAQVEGSDKSYKVYLSGEHAGKRWSDKFYWQHLTAEQRAEFIRMYNAREVNLEPQFGLYVLPFFCSRTPRLGEAK